MIPVATEEGIVDKLNDSVFENHLNQKYSPVNRTKSGKKISPDIKWKNLNYSVRGKQILNDCWGNVRIFVSSFSLIV